MIKVFNGKWRGLGETGEEFGMILNFKFRNHLKHFQGAKLAVFMAISLHTNEDGVSYPSYDTLEAETGYSRATVAKALEDLCSLQIDGHPVLARLRIRDAYGHFAGSNRYLIFPTPEDIQSLETKLLQSLVSPTVEKPNFGETKLEVKPEDLKDKPEEEGKPKDSPAAAGTADKTPGQRMFLAAFGAKRFGNVTQAGAVATLEARYGYERLQEVVLWAAKTGMPLGKAIKSIETAIPTWGQPKKTGHSSGNPSPRAEPASWAALRAWAEKEHINGNEG